MLWLLGCDVQLAGRVASPAGDPVVGAEVVSGDCRAVTGPDGAFLTRCPRGNYTFAVTHPTHASAEAVADASSLFSPPPLALTMVPWPVEPGLYLEPALVPLPVTPLVRTATAEEQRFCLGEGNSLANAPARVSLFDLHAVEWRAYALDERGCALVLTRPPGTNWWQPGGTRVAESSRTTLAPGRDRVVMDLPAGRYVAVAWYDGFLVPHDVATDTYLAWGIVAPGT